MEYQIIVNKYELNTLIDAIRDKISQEREYYQDFLYDGDDFAADLQSKTITELYMLLGKLTAIPQKGDK
jgi:hypothetical protein